MIVNARHAVAGREASVAGGANGPGPQTSVAPAVGRVLSNQPDALVSLTTRRTANRATIVIADRGAGIDPADLARIFDPYFTTKRGGTGLGLPIAKNIIEGLGGAISVASAPNQGTEISIDLPLSSTGVS
jgi:signal transduction histidine kinase